MRTTLEYEKVATHLLSKTAVVTTMCTSEEHVSVGLDNGEVHIYTAAGAPLHVLKLDNTVSRCSAISWGHLVLGCDSGKVESWNLEIGTRQASFQAHEQSITAIAFHEEEKIVTASIDFNLAIWSIKDWSCEARLIDHFRPVTRMAVGDTMIASASQDHNCKLWDLQSGALLQTLEGHKDQVTAVAIFLDRVVTGSRNGVVRVWDTKDGRFKADLRQHSAPVTHICIDVGVEPMAVTASADGEIIASALRTHDEVWAKTPAHPHPVNSLSIDANMVLSSGSNDQCRLWRLTDGKPIFAFGEVSATVWKTDFIGGDERIAHTFWDDGAKLEVWEAYAVLAE